MDTRTHSTNQIQKYVVGFMFDERMQHVALIEKNKPDWQRGRLNGIGGKQEPYEARAKTAMIREFEEEAGVTYNDWDHYTTLSYPHALIYVFRAFSNKIYDIQSLTPELINTLFVLDAVQHPRLITNLRWLIPMALDSTLEEAAVNFNHVD